MGTQMNKYEDALKNTFLLNVPEAETFAPMEKAIRISIENSGIYCVRS
jgi:hypothetical protein